MIKLKKLIKESLWGDRKFGEPLPTVKDYKEAYNKKSGMKINEAAEIEDVQDHESRIFDAIIKFKKTFGKSEWKKNRKINSLIKQFLKLERQLGDETRELT